MTLTRFLIATAAATAFTLWLQARRATAAAPKRRIEPGDGIGALPPLDPPVAETMWTPADPRRDGTPPSTDAR